MVRREDDNSSELEWQEPAIPTSLLATEWWVLPTSQRVVALTFDADWSSAGASPILSALADEDVPATFFLTGRFAERHAEAARDLAACHRIGNHTYSHPSVPTLSPQEVCHELHHAEQAIRETTGQDPRPLFRFPYGESDRRSYLLVNGLGYGSIAWTIDTLGWKGPEEGQTAETVVDRVRTGLKPGAIILMHLGATPDGSTLDADALPQILAEVASQGYGVATVEDFIAPVNRSSA